MDVKGQMEKATVESMNIIAKLIESTNGLYGLTSRLTFVDFIVSTMVLCVAECPNGNDKVKNMVNDR